jgi:predicted alternative tryptophan synthase beta-subunit
VFAHPQPAAAQGHHRDGGLSGRRAARFRKRQALHGSRWLPARNAYSICCAVDEALKCRESGEKKAIAFNISGHGFLDIPGYRDVLGLG